MLFFYVVSSMQANDIGLIKRTIDENLPDNWW